VTARLRARSHPLRHQVTEHGEPFELRVTGPAQRHLSRLSEGDEAAIVELMLSAKLDNQQRVGGRLQRELVGLHSAPRSAYRVIFEDQHTVNSLRIEVACEHGTEQQPDLG